MIIFKKGEKSMEKIGLVKQSQKHQNILKQI